MATEQKIFLRVANQLRLRAADAIAPHRDLDVGVQSGSHFR
jgi:hypothetical protein